MTLRQDIRFDLRQTAHELNIEPWRMSRLGRYLHIDADDKCIPVAEIERARAQTRPDDRYMIILHWLLGEFRARQGTA